MESDFPIRRRQRRSSNRSGSILLRGSPGYEYLKHHGIISDSACNNTFQREESSYCQSSYDKTNVKSRSMPMDKELMREEEIRWSSGVIAKLMGLNEQIPQRLVHKRKRVADGSTQKLSVAGIQGKYLIKDEPFLHVNMADHHEFNDNNDALETNEVERDKRKTVAKALPSLRQYDFDMSKACKSNVSSPGQSSMDAMEIPSNELYKMANKSSNNMSRQYCREHHFLRFQKEPNFKWLAPSHLESKKAISKSHNCINTTGEVSSPLDRITDRFPHKKKDVMCYFQRPMTCMASSSPIHPSVSFSHKLSGQHAARKNCKCIHHNHIRVKPNNDRSHVNRQMFYLTTPEKFWSSRRRRTAQPRIKETHNQGQNLMNFSLGMEGFGCREIARDTTGELREFICRDQKHMPIFGLNMLSGNGSSCTMPDMSNLLNSDTFRRSSGYFDDWSCNHDPGLAYSVKSRGSEAQKNLPKLKMTDYIKEGHHNIGSSLSAEYCLMSDMERKGKVYHSSAVHSFSSSFSDEKPTISSTRATCDSEMTVSERKCLDGRFFLNLPKPTLVPVPSTATGNQNARRLHQSNSQRFCSVDDVLILRPTKINQIGNHLSKSIKSRNHKLDSNLHRQEKDSSTREMHVVQENNSSTREMHMAQENKTTVVPVKASSKGNYKLLYVPSSADVDMFLKTTKESDKLSADKTNSKNIKVSNTDMKDLSSDHLQVDSDFLNHERRKKASQSCPVSIPEAHRIDDSGISITQNIDFHGHRSNDLTNSLNPGVKSSKMLRLSNEDSREESDLLPQSVYLEEDFMDEEERDYTYLLDILFVSGIHSSKQDSLVNACHLPEYPVNPTLFEKLEKKFGKLVAWSTTERKLMFDMTNSILAEILAPCMDPHPWVNSIRTIGPMWSSEGLVEKSWKILVKKRAELSFGNAEDKALDFKWLDLGGHINDIGCEIERLLKEELLEELVEFIQG